MDEMTMLDDFGAALDPDGPPPRDLRRRVLTGVMRPQPVWRRMLTGRTGMRVAVGGGLAAVLTAAVLAAQVVPFGGSGPAAQAQAADILAGAAEQARHQPDVPVRGDQFVHVESVATVLGMNEATKQSSTAVIARRVWLSVDGTRDGLIQQRPRSGGDWTDTALPGCHGGVVTQTKGGVTVTNACTPTPAYRGGLPTDADAMLAHLYRIADEQPNKNPRDQRAFTAAVDLVAEAYLSPASLAAVFGAVARIPGVSVVGDVTDEAGRDGVAVALHEVQGTRAELIFDRDSHAYLGNRSVALQDGDGLRAGQVMYSAAVLTVEIVDRAGV
ncbi:CU044_5270 family protein [Catellatospora vulcania]|uniref:CU044_5270 family protein n=1 Tax=Catellatospora vulcania TaxID=1460450 RepID=UPI0012D4BC5E|nr:CU044_5270 family protein [Catellatospora vulcania]